MSLTNMSRLRLRRPEMAPSLTKMSLRTVKDVALLTSQPSTTVSNVHHMLIRPKGALKYIRMFRC